MVINSPAFRKMEQICLFLSHPALDFLIWSTRINQELLSGSWQPVCYFWPNTENNVEKFHHGFILATGNILGQVFYSPAGWFYNSYLFSHSSHIDGCLGKKSYDLEDTEKHFLPCSQSGSGLNQKGRFQIS